MTVSNHFVSLCAFERHPASIERHTAPERISARGFSGITTWAPHRLDAVEQLLQDERTVPFPPVTVRQEAPSAIRPPPVPVRPTEPPRLPGAEDAARYATVPPAAPRPAEPVQPIAPFSPVDPPDEGSSPSADPLPVREPVAVLRSELPSGPAQSPSGPAQVPSGPAQEPPLAWPGSSPLVRPSAPDTTEVSPWEDAPPALVRRPRPTMPPRVAIGFALAICLAGLITAGVWYGPTLLGAGQGVTAVFNAPMMVVRSAASGRVVTVAATAAQIVDPKSPLLTIHTDESGQDRSVLAGVHGMIRSVETVPGAALVAGAPLVRLQDCDRAFLTIPPGTNLQAGQTVQVKLPDQKLFAGKIRASSGVMEPPDSLVVGLDPGAVTASCPVGHSATITPLQS